MQSKKIYTAYSSFDIIWFIIVRGLLIFGISYCLQSYGENPPVIIAAVVILFLFLLSTGSESIIIYEDVIVKRNDSLASLIFFKSKPVMQLSDVKKVWFEERSMKINPFELAVASLIQNLFTPHQRRVNKKIPIFFELNNGEEKSFYTSLSVKEVKKIVEIVTLLINESD